MQLAKRLQTILRLRQVALLYGVAIVAAVGVLLVHKLASLVPALSLRELISSEQLLGLHGMYDSPLYLPLNFVRSIAYTFDSAHGLLATRLPNVLFGLLTIIAFAAIVKTWHGTRIAILSGVLFACSAWTLHVSRLGSTDVLYLWAIVWLLGSHLVIKRFADRKLTVYGSFLLWGCLLYIPGMLWLIAANKILLRQQMWQLWRKASLSTQTLYCLSVLIWLPLLVRDLMRPGELKLWLGLPEHLAAPLTLFKQLAAVPIHIFVRGPQYPDIWLGKAPILDIATLVLSIFGIYFYVQHRHASRSKLLLSFALIGSVLVALGGPVGLSLLVPLAFLSASTGIAYLLHAWLQRFPNNPVARRFGVALIAILVAGSCAYNLRAYFVAWPHATDTHNTFRYAPQSAIIPDNNRGGFTL